MEGNLNQYMSLQGEHDSEERRSDRTPEETYTLDDNGLCGQEFSGAVWNRSTSDRRQSSALAQLSPETEALCRSIQSLERTISAHCQLLNRKSRSTTKSESSRVTQGINTDTSVVRGDKVTGLAITAGIHSPVRPLLW